MGHLRPVNVDGQLIQVIGMSGSSLILVNISIL